MSAFSARASRDSRLSRFRRCPRSFQLRLDVFLIAVGTKAVGELQIGALGNVDFHLFPIIFIVADALAVGAHRQKSLQSSYLSDRVLQLPDALGQVDLQLDDARAGLDPATQLS